MTMIQQTEPTFTKKFTLTLTVEGTRLQDIDDGLVEAAGERLKARMTNPPKMPVFVDNSGAQHVVSPYPTVARETAVDDIGNTSVVEGPKKRGRKPGQKVGPYKKHESEIENDEQNPSPTESVGEDTAEETQNNTPQSAAPGKNVADKAYSSDDAVSALKLVNSTHNVDKARACLEKFGVKRCGELTDENRGAFITYCESICK